ncbi:hypothetical protein J6590_017030 [Homalodisca vitripennis]|nr:hypothetical protein J6590_017030 [Homalodisca vitripennis]
MCGHAERALHPGKAVTMPDMALFGMVWLLRMRAEMRRCAKCRREEARWLQENAQEDRHDAAAAAASAPIFTVESAQVDTSSAPPPPPPAPRTPRTFCEVHGYRRKPGKSEWHCERCVRVVEVIWYHHSSSTTALTLLDVCCAVSAPSIASWEERKASSVYWSRSYYLKSADGTRISSRFRVMEQLADVMEEPLIPNFIYNGKLDRQSCFSSRVLSVMPKRKMRVKKEITYTCSLAYFLCVRLILYNVKIFVSIESVFILDVSIKRSRWN